MSKRVFIIYSVLLIMVTASVTFLALVLVPDSKSLDDTVSTIRKSITSLGTLADGTVEGSRNARLKEATDLLEKYYYEDIDQELITQGAIAGAAYSLGDPWTTFMTKEDYEWFNSVIVGEYSGVGLTVVGDAKDNRVTVVAPFEDTPAAQAGIKTGDKILLVDDVDVWGDSLDEAVARMKGASGTEVKLTVLKASDGSIVDVTITRAVINIKSIKTKMYGDIGYIRIASFDEKTAVDFEVALDEVKTNNVKGLVLDLRGNPGGLVDVCAEIAELLLPAESLIVYTEDRNGARVDYVSEGEYYDVPVVVLVDEGSASASEILAGALRDHGRAQLVGQKTFGKGLVQSVYKLPSSGDYMKITIARYFTPNGEDINKLGITPAFEVKNPEEVEITDANDEQLKKALELLK